MAVIDVQHAIAIEEHGGARELGGQFGLRPRVGFRYTDVDEVIPGAHAAQPAGSGEAGQHIGLE